MTFLQMRNLLACNGFPGFSGFSIACFQPAKPAGFPGFPGFPLPYRGVGKWKTGKPTPANRLHAPEGVTP
jgi:hypothetical protein